MALAIPETVFAAARLGDRSAIAKLLAMAQPDIRRYARATCRTASDAEDAAQETLWLLFRHVGTIRSFVVISRWLFMVVRRECLRLARRAGLFQELQSRESPAEWTFLARPEAEIRTELTSAIEALPEPERELILMRDAREMTIGEIAAELGLSRPAVKARLHRARLLLREYLTE
jgi:RNA polymerase sigma-70 factor (ECF subfamily)